MAKVLIVDDDPEIVDMVKDWLANENYTVESAVCSSEAKEFLAHFKYDIILLDLNLPDGDGMEICREFRLQSGQTPILMLTGKSDVADKTDGLDSGADDYLTKPFQLRELSSRIRALLRRSSQGMNNILQVGDLVLDPRTHSAKAGHKELKLYPKDFALLEFLMRNANQFFDTKALSDHVWTAEDHVSSENIRQSVHRLRGELEAHGMASLIENVRGVGYRVKNPEGTDN